MSRPALNLLLRQPECSNVGRSTFDPMTDTKFCSGCKERKAGSFFGRSNRSINDPYRPTCRACEAIKGSAYRATPSGQISLKKQRAKCADYQRRYMQNYRIRPEIRARKNELQRVYMKTEKGRLKRRIYEARRRARKRESSGTFSQGDIERILRLQRNRCAACRSKLDGAFHIDHIVALSNQGENSARNIQLLCEPCNLSKGSLPAEVFMREKHARLL